MTDFSSSQGCCDDKYMDSCEMFKYHGEKAVDRDLS